MFDLKFSPKVIKNILIAILVLFIISIPVASYLIDSVLRNSDKKNVPPPVSNIVSTEPALPVLTGEVIRKAKLDPSREYSESVFFINDQEIARYKNLGEKVYDLTGNIPNGKVKFVDATRKTYGEEYYEDNKKHGPFKEYYETGEIRREAKYFYGQLMQNKEYFINGQLRMEEDFEDVLIATESKDVGKGKIYFQSGKLMYEWNITNRDENRYTKAYNIEGTLVELRYFDKGGKVIKVVHPNQEIPAP